MPRGTKLSPYPRWVHRPLLVQTFQPAEQRESPKGRASLLELPGPRSPPLSWIVLAPEQSQGGHLIPACGGSWLSPQPFDWAAVMRERQLGGRGRKGASHHRLHSCHPLPHPHPAPSSLSGRNPGTEGVGTGSGEGAWGAGGTPKVRGWSELGVFCQGALLTRAGWAPSEVS